MRMRCLFFPLCSAIALTSFVQAQSLERHPLYEPALVSAGTPGDAGNLFAGAKVTASGHYGSDRPELAVDGQTNNAGKYWGCEGIPVWLQIDMGKPRTLSSLHVWPYWEGGRIYKYKIEGSEDGKNWKMLADQSSNSIAATPEGVPFKFNPQTVRYVKITFLGNSAGNEKGGHLVEIKGYGPDAALSLQAAAVKDYDRIPYNGAPGQEMLQDAVRLSGWRGERAGGQIAVWSSQAQPQLSASCAGVKNAAGQIIPVRTAMIRYTRGGQQADFRYHRQRKQLRFASRRRASGMGGGQYPPVCQTRRVQRKSGNFRRKRLSRQCAGNSGGGAGIPPCSRALASSSGLVAASAGRGPLA